MIFETADAAFALLMLYLFIGGIFTLLGTFYDALNGIVIFDSTSRFPEVSLSNQLVVFIGLIIFWPFLSDMWMVEGNPF